MIYDPHAQDTHSHLRHRKEILSMRNSIVALALLTGLSVQGLQAQTYSDVRSAQASATQEVARITPVREAILREAALTLGAQWGLGDRSREIIKVLEGSSSQLDRRFEFGALMLGVGYLPPVISEARDAVAIEGATMRVAKAIYIIDEPPRPVLVAPTWRDWLYVGLDDELRPSPGSRDAILPKDRAESAFWASEMDRAYQEGRKQADEVFDLNMARLQRSYSGMRRYYDLFKRGMVSAPMIVAASSVSSIKDPNTIVLGDVVFSVTVAAGFIENPNAWVPLAD